MDERFYKREELVGKFVVDQEARIVGKIKDLAITEDGKMGLLVDSDEVGEKLIDLDDIQKIRDVALLKPESGAISRPSAEVLPLVEHDTRPPVEPVRNLCSNCGHENKPTSKFCVKCGKQMI